MTKVIALISNFPNLTSVNIEFAGVCGMADDVWAMPPEETHAFRTEILTAVFAALNDPDHPTPHLRSLSIKNLQNKNDAVLTTSENFFSVLGRLTELRLRIVTEGCTSSPESAWRFRELYDFFQELPSVWLQPCRSNLKSLTLHCAEMWGYLPKADFRGLEIPNLKSLELGNWTITHNWQVDWILEHGQTLEKLVLDDCPIVSYTRNFGHMDIENYPTKPWEDWGGRTNGVYDRTWADVFRKLEDGLGRLKVFQLGQGEWYNDSVPKSLSITSDGEFMQVCWTEF